MPLPHEGGRFEFRPAVESPHGLLDETTRRLEELVTGASVKSLSTLDEALEGFAYYVNVAMAKKMITRLVVTLKNRDLPDRIPLLV